MKSLVFSFTFLLIMSSNAMTSTCTQQEAQFMGTVREVQTRQLDQNKVQCLYKIEYTKFDPSMICPLDYVDAFNAEFTDSSCQLNINDEVSGYMVKKGDSLYIE